MNYNDLQEVDEEAFYGSQIANLYVEKFSLLLFPKLIDFIENCIFQEPEGEHPSAEFTQKSVLGTAKFTSHVSIFVCINFTSTLGAKI